MDRATVIGFLGAVGLTAWCIGGSNDPPEPGGMLFLNVPGLILVIGGTLSCTLMTVSLPTFLDSWRIGLKVLFSKDRQLEEVVQSMVELAGVARSGPQRLEAELPNLEDPFLRKAVQMLVDGQPGPEIEDSLRTELFSLDARHQRGQKFFRTMGIYAPAFGLLTTLIGQVAMLGNIGSADITVIGTGMAFALLGTLYGALLSNLFCNPFADKLESRAAEEMLFKELYLQSVLAMSQETTPTFLRQKLLAFLDNYTAQRMGTQLAA